MLPFNSHRLRLQSLRVRLLAFVLLIVIPMAALITWNAAERRRHDLAEAEANALRFAYLAASTQEQTLSAARELLITIARDPNVLERNTERCSAYFAALIVQSPQYSNLSAVDIDGMNFFCSAIPANPGVNVTDRAWFQRALAERDFVIGDFIIGRTTGTPSISFAAPVIEDEMMTGVVVVSTSLEWLSNWMGQVELPNDSTLTVVDKNGITLARYPYQPDLIGQPYSQSDFFNNVSVQTQGTYEGIGSDGVERLYGYTRVEGRLAHLDVIVSLSKAVVLAPTDALQTISFLSLFLGGCVLLAISWWVATRFFVKPIGDVIRVTERLAKGDLSVPPILVGSFEEIDQLALRVHELAQALEARQIEARGFTAELQEEIHTRKRTEIQLREVVRQLSEEMEARQQAEEADALKLKFLGMISHELRTPLASIKGFASTLLARDVNFAPEKQRKFLQVIDQETDKLTSLVEQLLDLSRLQSGTLRIERIPQTIEDILNIAKTQLQTLSTQHQLIVQVPPYLPQIEADAQRIAQVLVNLVGNAAKFSPKSSPIIIRAAEMDRHIQLDVSDQGIGIPIGARDRVFEAFEQLSPQSPGQRLGAGLGLAICKSIVEAHGGRIWIQDQAVGTTISFELPIATFDSNLGDVKFPIDEAQAY